MTRSARRTIRRAAIATGAVLVGRSVLRRRHAMDPVPPELRSPVMWLPISLGSDRACARCGPSRVGSRSHRPPPASTSRSARWTGATVVGSACSSTSRRGGTARAGRCCGSTAAGWSWAIPEQSNEVCEPAGDGARHRRRRRRLPPRTRGPVSPPGSTTARTRWRGCTTRPTSSASTRRASPSAATAPAAGWPPRCASVPSTRAARHRVPGAHVPDARRPHGAADRRRGTRRHSSGHRSPTGTHGRPTWGTSPASTTRGRTSPRRDATTSAGLPPAWIGVGDLDLFFEEDLEYARRLEAAGVPCRAPRRARHVPRRRQLRRQGAGHGRVPRLARRRPRDGAIGGETTAVGLMRSRPRAARHGGCDLVPW